MKEPLATVVEITRPFSAPINYIRRWCAPFCRLRLANRGDKRAATITLKQHLTSLSGRPDESSHAFHSFDYPPIQPSYPSIPCPTTLSLRLSRSASSRSGEPTHALENTSRDLQRRRKRFDSPSIHHFPRSRVSLVLSSWLKEGAKGIGFIVGWIVR